MAEEEIRTRLLIEAQLQGVDDATRQGQRLQEALSAEDITRGFDRLEKQLAGVTDALRGLGKIGESSLSAIEGSAQRVERALARVETASDHAGERFRRARAEWDRSGSFVQGLTQGLGFGEYTVRGPGMAGQIAGRGIGTLARGIASAPFTGLAGLGMAASAIPGGGIAMGALHAGVGFAHQALEMQRQELAALPILDVAGGLAAARTLSGALPPAEESSTVLAARIQARNLLQGVGGKPLLGGGLTEEQSAATRRVQEIADQVREEMGFTRSWKRSPSLRRQITQEAERRFLDERAVSALGEAQAERAGQVSGAFRDVALAPLSQFRAAGLRLAGMDWTAANQFALTAGGAAGTIGAMRQQGLVGMSLAAQTVFGIGPELSGQFAMGGRLGALAGGEAGGEAFMRSLTQAMRLGLEGSGLQHYMQRMAEGIDDFRQTGIPLARETLGDLGSFFARAGLGAVRGAATADAVLGASRRVATQGPRDFLEMMMLQEVGFKGGGLGEYQRARVALELGEFGPKQLRGLYGRLTEGRDFETGAFNIARAQQGLFGQSSLVEARMLTAFMTGGKENLVGKEREAFDRAMARAGGQAERGAAMLKEIGTEAKLLAQAESMVGAVAPGVRAQAAIGAEQVETGQKLLPTMLNLERATTRSAGTVSNFGKQLETVTGLMTDLSTAIEKITRAVKKQ